MPDATDSAAKSVLSIGDLFNVDSAVPVDKATLVYDTASVEYKHVAPSATIAAVAAMAATDDATVWALANELKTKFDLLLVAAKAKGIIAAA